MSTSTNEQQPQQQQPQQQRVNEYTNLPQSHPSRRKNMPQFNGC